MFPKKFLPLWLGVCLVVIAVAALHGEAGERYAGSQACNQCHDDIYAAFQKNSHGISADGRTPAASHGCETCHGPGATHCEAEGQKPIFAFKSDSSTDVEAINANCLTCHTKNKLIFWHGSSHEQHDLSCTNCHSIARRPCTMPGRLSRLLPSAGRRASDGESRR